MLGSLEGIEPAVLMHLASGARSLPAPDAVRLYRRLLDLFPAATDPGPTQAQLAEWSEALGRRLLAEGQPQAALQAFRLALVHEPGNVAALRHVAELGGSSDGVEAQLLSMLNTARQGAGLAPLAADPAIAQVARSWSGHMVGVHLQ